MLFFVTTKLYMQPVYVAKNELKLTYDNVELQKFSGGVSG